MRGRQVPPSTSEQELSNVEEELEILAAMGEVLSQRRAGYNVNTIDTLPCSVWLDQLLIKAQRAKLATNREKLEDELLDTANYAVLILAAMKRDNPGYLNHLEVGMR